MDRYLTLAKELKYEASSFKEDDGTVSYWAKNYFAQTYGNTEQEAIENMLTYTAYALWFMVENREHGFVK